MAFVVKFKGTTDSLKDKMSRIRALCTSQVTQPCNYTYVTETKEIRAEKSGDEYSRVYVVIQESPNELLVILPYHVARVMLDETKPTNTIPEKYLPSPDFEEGTFNGILREKQKTDSRKILTSLGDKGYCYFMAHPGYGKTIIMAYVIAYLRQRAIVIVPSTSLSTQTVDTLRKRLPSLKVEEVDKNKQFPEDADVVICYIKRLQMSPQIARRYKTVVFDEVHLLTAPQGIPMMLSLRPKHLLAVTATEGDRKEMTECFVGKCEIQSLSDKKWAITFPKIRSNLKGDYSSVEGYTAAMGDLSKSEAFTGTIARMTRYFHSLDKRVIIITMRREMSTVLAEILADLTVSILSPDTPKCGNSDVIIGTHKFVGTGFDLANYVEDFDGKSASVAIFLGSIKNETLMYQTSGRAFRAEFPVAIYPQITDLPVSVNHIRMLKSYARSKEGCVVLHDYATFLEHFNE